MTVFDHFFLLIKSLRTEQNFENNHLHNIFRHFHVLLNYPLRQVKRCVIITYKHDIYELPHDLQIDLRFRILGN